MGNSSFFNFPPPIISTRGAYPGSGSCFVTIYKYNGLKNTAKEEKNKWGPTLEFCKHDKERYIY